VSKEAGTNQDNAHVDYELNLLKLEEKVVSTIKQRLVDAAGRESRAFELEIADSSDGKFYSLCNDLKGLENKKFVSRSCEIADLLAESQRRASIPGGYLIVIDATVPPKNTAIYIFIKAELHEALKFNKDGSKSQIELLENVFLSPSQKLYKIGILAERKTQGKEPNEKFQCFVYDHQFRMDGSPAEYFYKDFLSFSVDRNSKIQTKRFYERTEAFIKENIDDFITKQDLLNALKVEVKTNVNSLITPSEFGQRYFSEEIQDKYSDDVVRELPSSFVKDVVLIETKLNKKKIDFPDNINISGPDEGFDSRVSIIQSDEEVEQLNSKDSTYTIIKISGKPFSNE
jgi:hypothetical protein